MENNTKITLWDLCELLASPFTEITVIDGEHTLEYQADELPFNFLRREIDFIDSGSNGIVVYLA